MDKYGKSRQQQNSVEATGKTVEKALEKGLRELGVNVEDVNIEILDPGQKGVLSIFGSKAARVKVSRKKSSNNIEEIADEVTGLIMKGLDVNYRLFTGTLDDAIYINIETAGVDGLLIGRKGDTLSSLQHLVGRIISRRMGGYQRLTLDVGGYLKKRQEILTEKAAKAAERARNSGRDVSLEPMKASERRIIHMTLTNQAGISTYTVGNGEMRKVVISANGKQNRRDNRYNRR